jgi:hypothetical protein
MSTPERAELARLSDGLQPFLSREEPAPLAVRWRFARVINILVGKLLTWVNSADPRIAALEARASEQARRIEVLQLRLDALSQPPLDLGQIDLAKTGPE